MTYNKNLNGTKAISSVIVFRPNFVPTKQHNFKLKIAMIIVRKYANHEEGVKRFVRFHNLVVSDGYLEKK